MSDLERVTRKKFARDDAAYKGGVRDGFEQGAIFVTVLLLGTYGLVANGPAVIAWLSGIWN